MLVKKVRIETVLLSSVIVMAIVMVIQQQAKAESEQDQINALTERAKKVVADMHKTLTDQITKLRSCHGAENVTKCKMNVMGWSDQDAILALDLNKNNVTDMLSKGCIPKTWEKDGTPVTYSCPPWSKVNK